MSLRGRLLAAFAYVLVLTIVALEVPLALNVSRRVDAEVKSEATSGAQIVASSAAGSLGRTRELERLSATAARDLGERVIVVDRRGRLVADSAGEGLGRASYAGRPEIATALRGRTAQGTRRSKSEAHAAHGVHVPRRGRIIAELLAQRADVHVEGLRGAEPVHVPHVLDQLLAGDDRAGVAHQEPQDLELLACQLDRPPGLRDLVPRLIQQHVTDLEPLIAGGRLRLPCAPQHCTDAGNQLAGAERLQHVIVRTHLEADDPVRLLPARGEHDDRHVRVAAQLAADVVTGPVGKHHVEQHQVGLEVPGQRDALSRRTRDRAVEALSLESLGERCGDRGLVLDHQDRAPSVRHQAGS